MFFYFLIFNRYFSKGEKKINRCASTEKPGIQSAFLQKLSKDLKNKKNKARNPVQKIRWKLRQAKSWPYYNDNETCKLAQDSCLTLSNPWGLQKGAAGCESSLLWRTQDLHHLKVLLCFLFFFIIVIGPQRS